MTDHAWHNFNEGNWTNEIDVQDFIEKNYNFFQ